MKRIRLRATIIGVVAVIAGLAQAIPAVADDDTADTRLVVSGMTVTGFDSAVAAQNGFRIVQGADGEPRSVAVSDDAKAMEAAAITEGLRAGDGGATTNNTVGGNCGTSYLYISYGSPNLYVLTGFDVYLASAFHTWRVNYNGGGSYGYHQYNYDGGPAGPSWSHSGYESAPGSSSGRYGNVDSGSYALLVNGALCTVSQPTPYDYS